MLLINLEYNDNIVLLGKSNYVSNRRTSATQLSAMCNYNFLNYEKSNCFVKYINIG